MSTPSRKMQEASASGMQVLHAVARDPRAADELLQRLDMERHRHEEEISRLAAEKAALARYLANVYTGRTMQATPGRPQQSVAAGRRSSYSAAAPVGRGLFGSPDSISGPGAAPSLPQAQAQGMLQAVPPPVVHRGGMMAQTVALHGDSLTAGGVYGAPNPLSTAVSPDRADHPDKPRRSKTGVASRSQSVDERALAAPAATAAVDGSFAGKAPVPTSVTAPAWAEQLVSTVGRLEKRMGRLEAGVITSLLGEANSRAASVSSPSRAESLAGTPSRPVAPTATSGLHSPGGSHSTGGGPMTSPGGMLTAAAGPNPPNIFNALQLRQDAMLANIAERLDVTVKHLVRDALAELLGSVKESKDSSATEMAQVKGEIDALRSQLDSLQDRSVDASTVASLAQGVQQAVENSVALLAKVQGMEANVQQEQKAAATVLQNVQETVQNVARTEHVKDMLASSFSAFAEQLQAQQARAWSDMQLAMQQTLAQQAVAAADAAASKSPSAEMIATSCTTALAPALSALEERVLASVQAAVHSTQRGVDSQLAKVEASLGGSVQSLQDRLSSHIDRQQSSMDALRAQLTAVQEQAAAKEADIRAEINQCTESLEDLSTNIGELKNSLVEVQAGQDVVEATVNSVPHTIKATLMQELQASAVGHAKAVQEVQASLEAALSAKTAVLEKSVASLSSSLGDVQTSLTSSSNHVAGVKADLLQAVASQQAAMQNEVDKGFAAQRLELQKMESSLSSVVTTEVNKSRADVVAGVQGQVAQVERVLDSTVREACGAVQAQVATVAAALDSMGSVATAGKVEASQSLLSHVQGLEGRVEKVLTRLQQVQEGQTAAVDLQARVADSVRDVGKDIQSTRAAVDSGISKLSSSIASVGTGLTAHVSAHAAALEGSLSKVAAQAAEQGQGSAAAFTSQGAQLNKLRDAVSALPGVEAVSSAVMTGLRAELKPIATAKQLQAVAEAQAALTSTVDALKADTAKRDSSSALVEVKAQLESLHAAMSQGTEKVIGSVQEASKHQKAAIKEAVRADTSAVTASVQELVEEKHRSTATSMEKISAMVHKLTELHHSTQAQRGDGQAKDSSEVLQAVQKLAHGQSEASTSLSSLLEAVRGCATDGLLRDLQHKVHDRVQSLEEHLAVRLNEAERQRGSNFDGLKEEVQSSARHLESELVQKLSDCLNLVQAVHSSVVSVGDKVSTTSGQLLQAQTESKGQLLEQAHAHTALLQEIESGSLRQLRGTCSQILGMVQAEGDVLEEGGSTTATLAQHVAALNSRINDLGAAVSQAIGGSEHSPCSSLFDRIEAVEAHLERGIDETTRSVDKLAEDVRALQTAGVQHGGDAAGVPLQAQLHALEQVQKEQHGKMYASLRHIADMSMQAQLLLQGVQNQTSYLEEHGATGRDFDRVATAVQTLNGRLCALEETVHDLAALTHATRGGMQSLNSTMHTMDTALAIAVGKKAPSSAGSGSAGLPPARATGRVDPSMS